MIINKYRVSKHEDLDSLFKKNIVPQVERIKWRETDKFIVWKVGKGEEKKNIMGFQHRNIFNSCERHVILVIVIKDRF